VRYGVDKEASSEPASSADAVKRKICSRAESVPKKAGGIRVTDKRAVVGAGISETNRIRRSKGSKA
jgi:hypothetical protein